MIAFFACWLVSSLILFLFDKWWPTLETNQLLNVISKSFSVSIIIIVVLFIALKKNEN